MLPHVIPLNVLDAVFCIILLAGILLGENRDAWLKAAGAASLVVMAVFALTLLHPALIAFAPTSPVMWLWLAVFLNGRGPINSDQLMEMIAMQHAVLGSIPLLAIMFRFLLDGRLEHRIIAIIIGAGVFLFVAGFVSLAAIVAS